MMTTAPEPILSAETAIAALQGEDNQLRYYAAWWLGKHQIQAAWTVLCEALQDECYRTVAGGYPLRRQAARALGQLKRQEAVPALLSALRDTDDLQLREVVVQSLAAIGDRRAIPPLLALLQAGGEQPYEALIEALGTLQVEEAHPLVEPFLQHSSERVQCAAARYLFLITHQSSYLERIIQTLNHENLYLRWAAAFDLGAIGHGAAAQAILNAKIASSLKLLNLKRILASLLDQDPDKADQNTVQILFHAIDSLLMQL